MDTLSGYHVDRRISEPAKKAYILLFKHFQDKNL